MVFSGLVRSLLGNWQQGQCGQPRGLALSSAEPRYREGTIRVLCLFIASVVYNTFNLFLSHMSLLFKGHGKIACFVGLNMLESFDPREAALLGGVALSE